MSQVPLLSGNANNQDVINAINSIARELNGREVTEIIKDDTGVRRILSGKGKDGFYGLKVSKPTFDVYEASDDELILNSDQNNFKIVDDGTTSVNSDGSTLNWSSVPHGLDYTPIALGFLNNATVSGITTTGSVPLPTWGSAAINTTDEVVEFKTWVQIIPDDTYVHVVLLNSTGAAIPNLYVKYYLLQETAV